MSTRATLPFRPGSNGTEPQASLGLVNRTNVRFRYDSRLTARLSPASGIHASSRFEHDANALSTSTRNCRSGDCLNWDMLALWVFVVFSFAALVFAGYVIWVKCDNP